jgi:uncharacterized damage-inducible protein DinB
MTEIERIVRELDEAHAGHPWHGPSRADVLGDVTVEEAARRPSANAHGIWALVLHMHAWTREVARRMREGKPREPVEGDWPSPPKTPTEQAWRAVLAELEQAHRDIVAAIRESAPGRLDERGGASDDALGSGVTYRVMLHGLAQHDAYHTGQISLLKRIFRDGAAS